MPIHALENLHVPSDVGVLIFTAGATQEFSHFSLLELFGEFANKQILGRVACDADSGGLG